MLFIKLKFKIISKLMQTLTVSLWLCGAVLFGFEYLML
jgi:hypothetical protein